MCPDGSFVGREGLKCTFKKCLYTDPYEGMLAQQGENFFLIIEAPFWRTRSCLFPTFAN